MVMLLNRLYDRIIVERQIFSYLIGFRLIISYVLGISSQSNLFLLQGLFEIVLYLVSFSCDWGSYGVSGQFFY